MNLVFWLAIGGLCIIGGLGGIIRKKFVGEPEAPDFTGTPAVIVGSFFLLVGLVIIILALSNNFS